MFSGASNLAAGVDKAFIFIFSVAFLFIAGITIFMIFIVIRFNRNKNKPAQQFDGSVKLEILWTVVPTIIVLLMFYYGWIGFAPMRQVPDDAMNITAIGRMWEWEFDYGNGKSSKELIIPVNKPIKLDLVSEDVNHSLFIPAFRVKEDVVPGYNNYLWFTPYYLGNYDILCTEYCGLMHSEMTTITRVISLEDFDKWLEDLVPEGDIPDPPGLTIMKNAGCLSCHSLINTRLVGPGFQGLFGSQKQVISGKSEYTVIADEEYILNSIVNPDKEIVKGYNKRLMQSYEGEFSEEELNLMIDYFKAENDKK